MNLFPFCKQVIKNNAAHLLHISSYFETKCVKHNYQSSLIIKTLQSTQLISWTLPTVWTFSKHKVLEIKLVPSSDEKVGSEEPYSAEPVRQSCHKKLTRNAVLAHLTVGTCHQLSVVKCHQTLFRALRLLAKMY
jgi:hypothetical protein